MDVEQRNKLASIMFDIKHKIKDGEYKQFMDILGKKEPEPDLENIRMVLEDIQHKIAYIKDLVPIRKYTR